MVFGEGRIYRVASRGRCEEREGDVAVLQAGGDVGARGQEDHVGEGGGKSEVR